jgi:hypothetical protein
VAQDAVLIAGVIGDGAYDFLTAVKTPLEYLTSLNLTARARALHGKFLTKLELVMFYVSFLTCPDYVTPN